jgi:hypothetical protein
MVLETVCIVEENIDHCVFSFLFFSFLFLPFKIFSLRLPIFFFNLLNDLKQLIYIHNKLIFFNPRLFFTRFQHFQRYFTKAIKINAKNQANIEGRFFPIASWCANDLVKWNKCVGQSATQLASRILDEGRILLLYLVHGTLKVKILSYTKPDQEGCFDCVLTSSMPWQ